MKRSQEVTPDYPREHKLEFVIKNRGITFINDASSFSCNTLWFALESYDEPITWITIGTDNIDSDCSLVKPLVKEKVRSIITIGEEINSIHFAFNGLVDYIAQANTIEEAVRVAYRFAEEGSIVLFSPICPCDYKKLGARFKRIIFDLSY